MLVFADKLLYSFHLPSGEEFVTNMITIACTYLVIQ